MDRSKQLMECIVYDKSTRDKSGYCENMLPVLFIGGNHMLGIFTKGSDGHNEEAGSKHHADDNTSSEYSMVYTL